MDKELFADLTRSLREARAISQGKAKPSRVFKVEAPDVKAIREGTGLSQAEFAQAIGVNVRTLQNWEQHRRQPTGPAAVLLKIVKNAPKAALKAIHA